MTPTDILKMQIVMSFGAWEMQRQVMGAMWQMALWSMPGSALPGAGSICAPAGRGKGRA